MKYVLILFSLFALSLLGCQEKRKLTSLVNVDVSSSTAKNHDPNSPAILKSKAYKAKRQQAQAMFYDPAKYEEAEAILKELLLSDPNKSVATYKSLGNLYQRMGKMDKAAECYYKHFEIEEGGKSTVSRDTADWYSMYLAFKATGHEMDSRKALQKIIEKQKFDPDITYTSTSEAPSAAVLNMAQVEVGYSMLGLPDHEKGIAMLDEVAKKDDLTPKTMSAIAFVIRGWNRKETAISLLWRVYRSNSPKLSEEAKGDLIQLGAMKSEDGPGRRLN